MPNELTNIRHTLYCLMFKWIHMDLFESEVFVGVWNSKQKNKTNIFGAYVSGGP